MWEFHANWVQISTAFVKHMNIYLKRVKLIEWECLHARTYVYVYTVYIAMIKWERNSRKFTHTHTHRMKIENRKLYNNQNWFMSIFKIKHTSALLSFTSPDAAAAAAVVATVTYYIRGLCSFLFVFFFIIIMNANQNSLAFPIATRCCWCCSTHQNNKNAN